MTIVFTTPGASPAAHVLIVGVGRYRHLLGGDEQLFDDHEGLAQLSSPPVSARAMAAWFLSTYHNPDRPLASVQLLISDRDGSGFTTPDGEHQDVDPATFANTEAAVRAWKTRGDENRQNLMIFYFCGHGMASGLQTTLLMEDFGSRPEAPLTQAIDLNGLHLGMDKCTARDQCFFVDACRVASGELLRTQNFTGNPVIYGSRLHAPGPRNAPIYYSAMPGTRAFGRPGAVSFFTEALLKALDGAGSDNSDGGWRIQTEVLHTALLHLLRRAVDRTSAAGQLNGVDHLTHVTLHHLPGRPIVPVDVQCEPDTWNQHAVFSLRGADGDRRREPPQVDRWGIELEEGSYVFSAELQPPERGHSSIDQYVGPPYSPVRIRLPP